MQSRGGDCTPNRLTYNALLDGFLDYGKDDLAIEVLGKMLDARISPDRLSYAVLAGSAEPPQRRRQQQQQKGAQSPPQRGEQGGPVRVPRPPAPTVAVLLRVGKLFAQRRQRLQRGRARLGCRGEGAGRCARLGSARARARGFGSGGGDVRA
jgi:pentatricopeptide repeat protein